jgi:hypothetical protein
MTTQKTVEVEFTLDHREIAKKSYHEVPLGRGTVGEETYSKIMAIAKPNVRQQQLFFGGGKSLLVAFEEWEDGKMQLLGVVTDEEAWVKIGKRPPVKASILKHPSVTHYDVKYLVPDEITKRKLCEAAAEVSGIKVPLVTEDVVLGNATMKLVSGAWVGEFMEGWKTTKLCVEVRGKHGFVGFDSEISRRGEEAVALRYTFSKTAKLNKIEARAPSGEYVKVMDWEMKREMVESLRKTHNREIFTVRREFGSGEDKVTVDYLVTNIGNLMRVGINGTQYDDFSLRPAKVQKSMKEFMANRDVQEWYTKDVAKRETPSDLKEEYIHHTEGYELDKDVVKLEEPVSFAGHDIVSLRFRRNDLVTRAGPYSISVSRDDVTVSWSKEEKGSGKETTIMMQFKENEVVLCEGDKHLRMVTNLEIRDGKPYLKALNAKEVGILEKEKMDIGDGFLSIREVKRVISNPIVIGRYPSMVFMDIRLKQILEYEDEINQAPILYKGAKGLQHNHTIERVLEEHLRKKSLPPIQG